MSVTADNICTVRAGRPVQRVRWQTLPTCRPHIARPVAGDQNAPMHIVRVFNGPDGRSHFEDLEVPESPHKNGSLTEKFPTTMAAFRHAPAAEPSAWKNSPRRQLVVCLWGTLEVTSGDGEKRIFNPGDVLLADDVDGQGHISHDQVGPRRSIWIALPDDFDVSAWRIPPADA